MEFTDYLRLYGHKFHFFQSFADLSPNMQDFKASILGSSFAAGGKPLGAPKGLSKAETLDWVKGVLDRTRGRELPGNFNALAVGELFWEQSSKWTAFAEQHLRRVANLCTRFMKDVLEENCAKHVHNSLWNAMVKVALKQRLEAAEKELSSLSQDLKDYPINYNHHYTDTKRKRRLEREKSEITKCIKKARTSTQPTPSTFGTPGLAAVETIDKAKVLEKLAAKMDPNMDNHACEDALDSLMSIYKVCHPYPTSQSSKITIID